MNKNDIKSKIVENNLNKYNVKDEYKNLSVNEINKHQPKNGFAICLINLLGDLNIGNIIRSAVIYGADKVYVAGNKRYDKRSTVGAHNYINIEHIDCLDDDNIDFNIIFDRIKNDGFLPVVCELGGKEDTSFVKLQKPCFCFGNEGVGFSKNILDNNIVYSLNQPGVLRSLNVANAAAIFMYEWNR